MPWLSIASLVIAAVPESTYAVCSAVFVGCVWRVIKFLESEVQYL